MKNYILFGAPGAGKGTQSALIAKKYNLLHISTGDLLRKEMKNGSEIGLRVQKIISDGNLIDDSTVLELLRSELVNARGVNGFIYDGYPRTLQQAKDLEELFAVMGWQINAVISLAIDEEEIFRRILNRAKIEGRSDDADEIVIRQRIENFRKQTEPLVEYYKSKGIFHPVKGGGTIEEGFAGVCEIIDKSI